MVFGKNVSRNFLAKKLREKNVMIPSRNIMNHIVEKVTRRTKILQYEFL